MISLTQSQTTGHISSAIKGSISCNFLIFPKRLDATQKSICLIRFVGGNVSSVADVGLISDFNDVPDWPHSTRTSTRRYCISPPVKVLSGQ